MTLESPKSKYEGEGYYKAAYQNNNYYTILSAGTDNETSEIWGVIRMTTKSSLYWI